MILFSLNSPLTPGSAMKTRQNTGNTVSIIGIIVNLFLFAVKLFAGLATHSVAVIGDAFNNLSDAGTSALTFLSFYLAAKPPDKEHPFGHARIEYLFSAVAASAIMFVGIQIGLEAFGKIRHPVDILFHPLAFFLLLLSILAKLGLFLYYRKTAKRIDSDILKAAATDSLADILSTGAIVLSLLLATFIDLNADGWMGLIVALIIVKAGFEILQGSVDKLLGKSAPEETKQEIETFVLNYPGIHGVHDLIVHDYGPGRTLASIHAEVDANESFLTSHDTVDRIEVDAKAQLGVELIIHLDPLDFDDPRLAELTTILQTSLMVLHPKLQFHDFRMIDSHYTTNLIFDLVLPRACPRSEDEITEELNNRFQEEDPRYQCIITFDTPY